MFQEAAIAIFSVCPNHELRPFYSDAVICFTNILCESLFLGGKSAVSKRVAFTRNEHSLVTEVSCEALPLLYLSAKSQRVAPV